MQNNFRLSKTKNNILYALSGVSLALFAGLMLFPTISEATHAEGDEPEEGITVVANNNIEINLLSTDEGYYKIAKDTVTVSTGSEYGYTLYLSTDSADHQSIYLNGDTSSESKISGTTGTYESPAALADEGYSWGWAVPGISHFDNVYNTTNPDAESKFAVMPLENKIIHEYTTEATEDATDVYYGFKLEGTLEPGEYETAISYTAVSADAPLVARAILGDNGNLNFVYDRHTYTAGDAYTDNIGETKITNVYEVPTDAYIIDTEEDFSTEYCPAWTDQMVAETIYSANFDSSFYGFKPTSTSCWFYSLENLASVTNANRLNTSDATNMHSMFERAGHSAATFSLDLSSWDTGNVADMAWMLSGTGSNTTTWSIGNLSGWDTSSVTNMCGMFSDAGSNATSWNIGDLSGWDTGNVTNMDSMFYHAGESATTWGIGDVSEWDVAKVTEYAYFVDLNTNQSNASVVNNQPHWNRVAKAILGENGNLNFVYDRNTYTTGETYTDNIGETKITNVYEVSMDMTDCEIWDGPILAPEWTFDGDLIFSVNIDRTFVDAKPISTCAWFAELYYAEKITGLENLDTSRVTNMAYMFGEFATETVADIELGVGNLDTRNVTNMRGMFINAGYSATTISLDVGGWDTSNVTDMSLMFSGTGWNIDGIFNLDIDDWDTSNVSNMESMFEFAGNNAAAFSLDLSGWETGSVTNMSRMLASSDSPSSTWSVGDLSGWDTSNVTDMSDMFSAAGYGATTFDIGDLGSWHTDNVTNMSGMFRDAGRIATTWSIGDLSGWDTNNTINMDTMFQGAGYGATTFDIGDLGSWHTDNVTNMQLMFNGAGYEAATWNIGDISGWSVAKVTDHSEFIYLNANESNASVVNNQPNWSN